MKNTVSIDMSHPMAKPLFEYLERLPFVGVEKREETSFEEAAKECNAIGLDELFDLLDERIRRRFHDA